MKSYEEYLAEARQLLEQAVETGDTATAWKLIGLLHDQCLLQPAVWQR